MQLEDIAEVFSGYAFRERLGAYPMGDITVIQMKNIDSNDHLDFADVPRLSLPDLNERHLLLQGDVLLRARGLFHTAALVAQKPVRAVAAAPLMVIRVTSTSVTSSYLRWFLNLSVTQTTLTSLAAGSHVQTLNKAAIEGLVFQLPGLLQQRRIADLAELGVREKSLAIMIAEKKSAILQHRLVQCVQGTPITEANLA